MFLAFLFKWAIALTLLFSLYGLLLRRETFYRVNRFVLLGMLPLSACLTMVRIETQHATVANRTVANVTDWMATPAPDTAPSAAAALFSGVDLLLYIYIIGLAIVVTQYLVALVQVIRFVRQGRPEKDYLVNDAVESPFSWFRWIVISSADIKTNGRIFLAHERAHVRHGHSWDMLLCEVCVRLQWFNPFAWQLRDELRAVHEYQADQGVLREGCNIREYNMLLIDKAVGAQLSAVTNALTQSELKSRIRMMHRKPSAAVAMLKVLYVVPLALVTLAIFAKPIAVQNIVNARNVKVLVSNVQTLVNPRVGDAEPIPLDPPEEAAKPATDAPRPMQVQAAPAPEEKAEPASQPAVEERPTRPRTKDAKAVEAMKATNPYKREHAEKAIGEYMRLSMNTHRTGTYVTAFVSITMDREGRITRVDLPQEMLNYDWWNPAEVERKVRTIPRELTRDYVNNLDNPSNANTLGIELRQYLDL